MFKEENSEKFQIENGIVQLLKEIHYNTDSPVSERNGTNVL